MSSDFGTRIDRLSKQNPRRRQMPDNGYAICYPGCNVHSYYSNTNKSGAVRAAQKLAAQQKRVVDLVRITNRGEDRYIIDQFEPPPHR